MLGAFAGLQLLGFGTRPLDAGVDPVWTELLGRATAGSWRFGVDIVFTYGPLGFLNAATEWNPAFGLQLVIGQIGLAVYVALSTGLTMWRLAGPRARLAYAISVVLVLPMLAASPWLITDAVLIASMLQVAFLARQSGSAKRSEGDPSALWIMACAFAGAIALYKLSLVPVSLATTASICVSLVVGGAPTTGRTGRAVMGRRADRRLVGHGSGNRRSAGVHRDRLANRSRLFRRDEP